jgi:hypothetical protein
MLAVPVAFCGGGAIAGGSMRIRRATDTLANEDHEAR